MVVGGPTATPSGAGMSTFNCSDVNFYAPINLEMGREKGLEVKFLPSPALGWGEVVPKASHSS